MRRMSVRAHDHSTPHPGASANYNVSVTIFRTDTHIINGISGQVSLRACVIQLKDPQIIDFKFLNGDVLLVLYSSPSPSSAAVHDKP